jgi:hypothetical protein
MNWIVPKKCTSQVQITLELSPEAVHRHWTSTSYLPHAHRPFTVTPGGIADTVVNGIGRAEWST